MTSQPHDVVGIGNALVDVLSHEDDGFIDRFGLAKGGMALIDTDRAEELYAAMQSDQEVSGGSAAVLLVDLPHVVQSVTAVRLLSGKAEGWN